MDPDAQARAAQLRRAAVLFQILLPRLAPLEDEDARPVARIRAMEDADARGLDLHHRPVAKFLHPPEGGFHAPAVGALKGMAEPHQRHRVHVALAQGLHHVEPVLPAEFTAHAFRQVEEPVAESRQGPLVPAAADDVDGQVAKVDRHKAPRLCDVHHRPGAILVAQFPEGLQVHHESGEPLHVADGHQSGLLAPQHLLQRIQGDAAVGGGLQHHRIEAIPRERPVQRGVIALKQHHLPAVLQQGGQPGKACSEALEEHGAGRIAAELGGHLGTHLPPAFHLPPDPAERPLPHHLFLHPLPGLRRGPGDQPHRGGVQIGLPLQAGVVPADPVPIDLRCFHGAKVAIIGPRWDCARQTARQPMGSLLPTPTEATFVAPTKN